MPNSVRVLVVIQNKYLIYYIYIICPVSNLSMSHVVQNALKKIKPLLVAFSLDNEICMIINMNINLQNS